MGKGIRQYHNWLLLAGFTDGKVTSYFLSILEEPQKKKLDKEKYQQQNFFIQKKNWHCLEQTTKQYYILALVWIKKLSQDGDGSNGH